jgi:hypothetical protein
MLFGCGIVLIFLRIASTQQIWSREVLSSIQDVQFESFFQIDIFPMELCVQDVLTISWKATQNNIMTDNESSNTNIMLAVSNSKDLGNVIITPLIANFNERESSSDETTKKINNGYIQCLINHPYCIPSILNITSTFDNSRVSINFGVDTNEPDLFSTKQINEALDITPQLTGSAVGQWITPNKLEIVVDENYLTTLHNAYYNKEIIQIIPKLTSSSSINNEDFLNLNSNLNSNSKINSGEIKFRPIEHGEIKIFIINKKTKKRISKISDEIKIKLCETSFSTLPQQLLNTYINKNNKNSAETVKVEPIIKMEGVLAVNGDDPVLIGSNAFDALVLFYLLLFIIFIYYYYYFLSLLLY